MSSDLATQQRRFHALATGQAPLHLARALLRDDGVDPVERMRVYAHAYVVRIRGALAAEYPKLAARLGDPGFARLTDGYLAAHPTRHPSLRDAGVDLPGFLADQPALADLARLERARTEVFDAADAPPLTRAHLTSLPAEAFPALPLRLVPASALVDLASNADEVWSALEDGALAPPSQRDARTVLVWRRDVAVVHRTAAADEAAALRRIAAGDATFADVCETLTVERALALVLGWLDAEVLVA